MKTVKIRSDQERRELIEQVDKLREKGSPIMEAVKEVGISDASYYTWKKRLLPSLKRSDSKKSQKRQKESVRSESIEKIKPTKATKIKEGDRERILEIKACFPHMGVKQLRQHMIRNHKLTYSERQLRQFLEEEGVPKLRASFPPQPVRRFERDFPNEMWQIDIMNFHVGSTALYLTSFLDDYSRFIVSYMVTEEQSSTVVMELLRRAIAFRKPLSIITDRGIQFCSWNGVTQFQLELQAQRIDHLKAREQHPETMGKIEAFHKTIKRELLTTTEFSSIDEAKERIHDYIMFYNFARPHMGIDNKAPGERYFKKLKPFNPDSVYYQRIAPFPNNGQRPERRDPTIEETASRGESEKQQAGKREEKSQKREYSAKARHRGNRRDQRHSGQRRAG